MVKRSMRTLWQGYSCFLLLVGCVSIGNPGLTDDATIARITVGETTKQQVGMLLGQPADQGAIQIADATREWWSYSYASTTINPLEYILLYGFWTNGIGLYDIRYDLRLSFDDKGIVSGLSLLSTSYDMGGPMSAMRVTGIADNTIGVAGPSGRTVRFVDKVEYRD
jgi:hypothetical protein